MFSGWALSFEPRIRLLVLEPAGRSLWASAFAELSCSGATASTTSSNAAATNSLGRISKCTGFLLVVCSAFAQRWLPAVKAA